MKTCNKCTKDKPLEEFYFRKDTNTYRNECKDCTKAAKAVRESRPGVKAIRALTEKQRRIDDKERINKVLRDKRNTIEGKQKTQEAQKKYVRNNPEKVKATAQAVRAKRKTAISDPTKIIKEWAINSFKVCTYCSKDCTDNYHIDHIEPLSKGGTNTIDNLTISCPTCNVSKNATTLIIWLVRRTNRSKG